MNQQQPTVWYRYAILLFLIGWAGMELHLGEYVNVIVNCALGMLYLSFIPTLESENELTQ